MDLAWPNNLRVDGLCTHRWVSVLAVMTLLTNDRRPSAWSPANPISNSHVESLKIGIYEVPGIMSESICPLPWTMAEARREGCKRSASLILDSVRLLFHKCLLVRHWSQCWLHRLGCHGDERAKIKWEHKEKFCHSEIQQEKVTRFPLSTEPCLPGLPCQIRAREGVFGLGILSQSCLDDCQCVRTGGDSL